MTELVSAQDIESINNVIFRNRIVCPDGFTLSVQASAYHYSIPRSNEGPYTHAEVGFPSERPEPWFAYPDGWMQYAEDPEYPTETVYSFVPVDLIWDLIQSHGGLVIESEQQKEIEA